MSNKSKFQKRDENDGQDQGKKGRFKGFFDYKDEGGPFGLRLGKVVKHAVVGVLTATTALSSVYVQNANEKTLEVLFGKPRQQVDNPGLKLKVPYFTTLFTISTAPQSTFIDEGTKLRTGDDVKMNSGFEIQWRVRPDADIMDYYKDLNRDDTKLPTIMQSLANAAAVSGVETMSINDLIPPLDENGEIVDNTKSFTKKMAGAVHKDFQGRVDQGVDPTDEKDWGVETLRVLPRGFSLDPISEEKIAEIVSIRQEGVKLSFRQQNAAKATEVLALEAAADAGYIAKIQELNGITDPNALAEIFCIKTAKDLGTFNAPFTPGCAGGFGASTDVAVPLQDAEKASTFQPQPQQLQMGQ